MFPIAVCVCQNCLEITGSVTVEFFAKVKSFLVIFHGLERCQIRGVVWLFVVCLNRPVISPLYKTIDITICSHCNEDIHYSNLKVFASTVCICLVYIWGRLATLH